MKKTVIELFAGVGGFRVGLNDVHEFDEETGIAIAVSYTHLDVYKRQAHKHNYYDQLH